MHNPLNLVTHPRACGDAEASSRVLDPLASNRGPARAGTSGSGSWTRTSFGRTSDR